MYFYVAMEDLGRMYWGNADKQCKNYSFCGDDNGKLPSKEQLLSIYRNKSQLNSLLSAYGGRKMSEDWYWSSTYSYTNGYDYDYYYIVHMSNGDVSDSTTYPTYSREVRPIII